MNASPFAHMAAVLQKAEAKRHDSARAGLCTGLGPVATMLQVLQQGRQCAATLAQAAGVKSAQVMPLLKNHLKTGRVASLVLDGRTYYELQSDADADLQRQIRRACQLLSAHGYRVERREGT